MTAWGGHPPVDYDDGGDGDSDIEGAPSDLEDGDEDGGGGA